MYTWVNETTEHKSIVNYDLVFKKGLLEGNVMKVIADGLSDRCLVVAK